MNIVYHSSDSFAPVLAVSIMSVMVNNTQTENITFYVIENKISEDNKSKLKGMVKEYGREIIFIPMPDLKKDFNLNLLLVQKKWVFDSYCRMFLGTILPPTEDRTLYLDCDTLCHSDISEYYNTSLEGYCCAGVTDCLGEKYYEYFEMNESSRYVNSGAILINLDAWRKENIEQKVVDYVASKKGYVFFMEQSVLNIVLQDKIKIVHPKYNTFTLMISLSRKNLLRLRDCPRFYPEDEVNEAIGGPSIIHLTNFFYVKGRPWIEGSQHPFNDIFMKYRAMTPWRNEPLFKDNTPIWRKILMSIIRFLPQGLVCSFIGWIYNSVRPVIIKRDAEKKRRLYK